MHIPRSSPPFLGKVYWIGGPPDAGKSSVAQALQARVDGAVVYREDAHEREHIARADPIRYPLHGAMRQRLADDPAGFLEAWASQSPETLAADARANWIERMPLIVEDLLSLETTGIVIAEGPGFFPSAIRPLLPDAHHAAWLIPSETFKRSSHERRNKSAWKTQTSNPKRALDNHIARDLILADAYRTELEPGDFWLETDGSRTIEETAAELVRWFGLPPRPRR